MTNRRKFLQILGVGTASAPLAAKEALDKGIADLTLRDDNASPLAPSTAKIDYYKAANEERRGNLAKVADMLRSGGRLPEYAEKCARETASYVHALDPDIASKRSWSMNVKIAAQRETIPARDREDARGHQRLEG